MPILEAAELHRGIESESTQMTRGKYIAGYLAGTALLVSLTLPFPCVGQKNSFHPPPAKPETAPAPRAQVARPHADHPVQQGHAGDWLRRYKDLPPEEQERALQNDPAFQHLPPERQQILRQRLQHFESLPPQQQLRMLNRMETWEHLTPGQKQQARLLFGQMRQLPPDRRRQVMTAVRDLRSMPPYQRDQVIDSPRFRSNFSDQEREMIRDASRLPLAPAEGGEAQPPE